MRLYILESFPQARALAEAFDGKLKQNGRNTASFDVSGRRFILLWRGGMRLLANTERPAVSEQMEELLSETFEKEAIREIFCLLFPTKTALLFADCLQRTFKSRGAEVFSSFLTTLRKEDVIASVECAKKLTPEDLSVIQATGERHNAFTLAGVLRKLFPKEDPPLDLALLCALFLINARESVVDSRCCRIETAIKTERGILPLVSCDSFTREGAEKAAADAGNKLFLLSEKIQPLPSAAALCSVYNGFAPKGLRLKETAVSLFDKGYISNPFTLCGSLSENAGSSLKPQIIAACRAQFPSEDLLDIEALSRFAARKADLSCAIVPLKESTASLTAAEEAVYQNLVFRVKNAVCEREAPPLRFLDKKTGILFSAPSSGILPDGKLSLSTKPFSIREDGTFQSLSPEELVEKLISFGLDSSDVILLLPERLLLCGAAYSDTLGLHLTPKGAGLVRNFPAEAESVLSLFQAVCSSPKDPTDINAHLVRVSSEVSRAAESWLSAGKKDSVPKKDEAEAKPIPEGLFETDAAASSSLLPCPFCGQLSFAEEEHRFVCSSCGASLEKLLQTGGALYSITKKDVLSLSETGRTKFKRGKNADGKITAGGYISLPRGVPSLSHRSEMTCPYCAEHLEGYAWGFHCPSCGFGVPFEVFGVRLKTRDLKKLLAGKKTDPIQGLISPHGEVLCARLLSMPGGKIRPYRITEEEEEC